MLPCERLPYFFFGAKIITICRPSNLGCCSTTPWSASGYKCRSANRNHILTKKTTKRKRHLRGGFRVRDEDKDRIKQMLPYQVV